MRPSMMKLVLAVILLYLILDPTMVNHLEATGRWVGEQSQQLGWVALGLVVINLKPINLAAAIVAAIMINRSGSSWPKRPSLRRN